MPDSHDLIVRPEIEPICSAMNVQIRAYEAGMRSDSGIAHQSQNWLNRRMPAPYVERDEDAKAPLIASLAASASWVGSCSRILLSSLMP